MDYRLEKTDVLIVGSGITGLRAAVEASTTNQNVLVISKGPRCSWGIGGFNAPIHKNDSTELYYQDILKSGCGLSDTGLAKILAANSIEEVRFLERSGMIFDHTSNGDYDLLKPLGCSVPRLVHRGTQTGSMAETIFMNILRSRNVEIRETVTALDIISDGQKVYGVTGIENGRELVCYLAKSVVMAAGGCGHMYAVSTYPAGIQGDSYGMMIRAGCEMIDMEFMQFEPCCLTEPAQLRGRGISTTMLTAGAVIRNPSGEEFLHKYFPDLSLVQKSELSRAIYAESQKYGGAPLEYDLTMFSREELDAHCLYSDTLRRLNYDPLEKPLMILPAAHTFLGGAYVNEFCETTLQGLYAAGEAMGGLHGANRIGGCAGAETFVFGAIAGKNASGYAAVNGLDLNKADTVARQVLSSYSGTANSQAEAEAEDKLQSVLSSSLSLIRDGAGCSVASKAAKEICFQVPTMDKSTPELLWKSKQLENKAMLIHMIADASVYRKESRGVFFRSDYPEPDNQNCLFSVLAKDVNGSTCIRTLKR